MAIQDITTPVDLLAGMGDHARQDGISPPHESQETQSDYQRALSRTLNDGERRDVATENRAETHSDRSPDSNGERDTERTGTNRSTPDSGQDASPTSPTDERHQRETTEADPPNETQSSRRDDGVADGSAKGPAESEPVLSNPDPLIDINITVNDEVAAKPPAELSQLFPPKNDSEAKADITLPIESDSDGTVVRPPNGLFNSSELASEQQGEQASRSTPSANMRVAELDNGQSTAPPGQAEHADGRVETEAPGTLAQSSGVADSAVTEGESLQARPILEGVSIGPTDIDTSRDSQLTLQSRTNDTASESNEESTAATVQFSQPGSPLKGAGQTTVSSAPVDERESPHDASRERVESQAVRDVQENQFGSNEGQTTKSAADSANQTTESTEKTAKVDAGDSESVNGIESQKSSPTIAAPAATSTVSIPHDTRVGSLGTGLQQVDSEQLVERVATAVQSAPVNGQQLRVRLYPPHLGSLQVEVTSNGGALTVRMEVHTVNAQSALLDNLSSLREALVSQGSVVDRIDVQLVETTADEGRPDLMNEQHQEQLHEQNAEDQAHQDEEEQPSEDVNGVEQASIPATAGIDELDIQI